jgi:hypothetical protein
MISNLSGSFPFLAAELDYRRERLLAVQSGRRASRAVGPRRDRKLHRTASATRPHRVPAAS